jgi:hypothetical protein
MASSSKKRTTMAKMNRETALREKRIRKAARKEARRLEAAAPPPAAEQDLVEGDDAPAERSDD